MRVRIILWCLIAISILETANAQSAVELICPEHVTINCERELGPIKSYGIAMYRVDDVTSELESQQSKKNIDDCGKGKIERIWRYKSEDKEEYTCSQYIYIGQQPDGKPLIDWPTAEVIVSWCDPSYKPRDLAPAAQGPNYFVGECNKMEHTYSDEIVYPSDRCKEVHRHWLVHDWCYDSKEIEGNDGHYKFTQVIKFAVPEEVSYGEVEDVFIEAEDCEKVFVNLEDMKANIDGCSRRVRIYNDSPFAEHNGKNASGTYPVGETTFTYKVKLACTEAKEFTQRIVVSNPCQEETIMQEKELEVKLQRSFVRPNPFSQSAEIYFNSTSLSNAELMIKNTKGVEVLSRSVDLTKEGMHSFKLSSKELSIPGVYLYTVSVGDRVLEGKLIKIR